MQIEFSGFKSRAVQHLCIHYTFQRSAVRTFTHSNHMNFWLTVQVVPMEELNLHLTGDIHAVGAATNLLAAAIDARMFHEAAQSDAALLKRICPIAKDGKRQVAPVLHARLERLGIHKDINDLSPEELRR